MKKDEIYSGELCCYWEVEEIADKKLLEVCEKAVEILLAHDWHDLNYGNGEIVSRAEFNVEGTDFTDCKVIVCNDEGEILTRLVGKLSKETRFNDFEVDLSSHPKIGDAEQYSYNHFLAEEFAEKE